MSDHARDGIAPTNVYFANGSHASVVEVLAEVVDGTDFVLLFDPGPLARQEVKRSVLAEKVFMCKRMSGNVSDENMPSG